MLAGMEASQAEAQISANEPQRTARTRSDRFKPAERAAIIADAGAGLSLKQLAAKYNRSVWGISRIVSALRDSPVIPECRLSIAEQKQALVNPAFQAVSAGIQDDTDNYKRGALAVSVLKGIGVFQPDSSTTYNTLVATMPATLAAHVAPHIAQSSAMLALPASESSD